MTFDLKQLNAFLTIISTGSLGRAAETLHITQPALSRTVRRLEQQVGAPLFERHSKGMQLTAIGSTLLPHATLLLREAENATEEIDAMRGLAKGTIRIGAVGAIASLILPMAIGAVLKKWPQLTVFVIEGVWDRLTEGLVKHEIDLALGAPAETADEIEAIADCRWQDQSNVIAATSHPLRRKRKLTLEDTMSEQWAITPRGTAPYQQMQQVFRARGLGLPNIVVETRSIIVLKSLVARSGFLGWMPESVYDAERRARLVNILDIPGATSTRTLTAFKRRQGILPVPAIKLLEELRRLAARSARW
ncbi:LysR family transcriptional regulator [Bradyrhizobium manausense]|uniref:LysR family transcriptional regulator n=1 Tax=Bradyrhizobium manausense TaxID=989370 RepID=UPI001BA8093D|nr:LysR family transcriptional regulator [Bradyrhizobium manausense]MBR0725580.1 LysR family transcriptional regulator [Bradyrhizobium manausense]